MPTPLFHPLLKLAGKISLVVGVLLSFFAIVEVLQFYILLKQINLALANAFILFAVFLGIGLLIYFWRNWLAYPRALKAPNCPPLEEATNKEMHRYGLYLRRYLHRLAENPSLSDEDRNRARQQIDYMNDMLRAHPLNDDLKRTIVATESEVLLPLLHHLKDTAEKEIRRSVRDVMLGITISPYRSFDILMVLYRNTGMILRIVHIYATRPAPAETWRIFRDVLKIVATVNFFYVGRSLVESLFTHVPMIGRMVEDIGEGLGAGLFTSATGHATCDRCAAFKGWQQTSAAKT